MESHWERPLGMMESHEEHPPNSKAEDGGRESEGGVRVSPGAVTREGKARE